MSNMSSILIFLLILWHDPIMKRTLPAASLAALSFSALLAQGQPPPNTWTTGAPMPTPREGALTGVIGTKIYVIGGANNSTTLNVNEVYDTGSGTWSTAAAMPTARWNAASAVVNNILYAIGGGGNGTQLSVVEAYDPSSNTWTTKAPMPASDQGMYATVVNNIIYIAGGCCNAGGVRLANVMSYNPTTNSWTVLAPLKIPKSQSAVGFLNSMVISAGGLLTDSDATTDNEGYNITTNAWTTLPALPTARQAGCFETAGNTLYFAGGHSIGNGNPLATMDAYDGDKNSWTAGLPAMPFAAVNIASASAAGRLYCFGGSDAGNPGAGNIFNYTQIYQPDIPPSISAGGVVSASAFGEFTSASPGSWIEIYGANLSPDTRGWTTADFNGISAPTSLDGVSVTVGGQSAFIDYISPGQINALLPSDTPTEAQPLIVTNGKDTSTAYTLTVNSTLPGFLAPGNFNINGVQYAVAIFTDGAYALPTGAIAGLNSRPAKPGDVLTLYGVGFGPVTPNIPAGQLVQQESTLALPLQLSIGGLPASLFYDGLAPDFTGLYQFNVTMPSTAPGNAALAFSLNGVSGTQTLYIAAGQ
jgi:uncharacterized protein (TIGR03437 family)